MTTTVTCKHGPLECAGNTQQLCFRNLFLKDWKVWYAFVIGSNTWEPKRIGEENYALQTADRILNNLDVLLGEGGDNLSLDDSWGTKAEDWEGLPFDDTLSSTRILARAAAAAADKRTNSKNITPETSFTDPENPELETGGGGPSKILQDFQKCFQGPEGFQLLVESVQHTIDNGVG